MFRKLLFKNEINPIIKKPTLSSCFHLNCDFIISSGENAVVFLHLYVLDTQQKMIIDMTTINPRITPTRTVGLIPERTETHIIIKVRAPEENLTHQKQTKKPKHFLKDLWNEKASK